MILKFYTSMTKRLKLKTKSQKGLFLRLQKLQGKNLLKGGIGWIGLKLFLDWKDIPESKDAGHWKNLVDLGP